MPKDYKQRPRRRGRNRFPLIRLLLTGVFIAAFVGFLLFLGRASQRPDVASADRAVSGKVTVRTRTDGSTPSSAPAATGESTRPSFEFYTLLPEKEVYVPLAATPEGEVDRDPSEHESSRPQALPPAALPGVRYELQVASLRDAAEAESLRAKLLLLGFAAHVRTVRVAQQTWHRVRVGPFDNLERARQTRARLRRQAYEAIVINLPG